MKITLIEPAMIKTATFSEKAQFLLPPLTLSTLAGLTPAHIEVEVIDDRIETIDFDAPRDLVGISVKTYTARRAYQIAQQFRQRGVRVVLGGHHPTLLPDEAQHHADALVLGEAEGLWPQVLADAQRGALQPRYAQPDTLPFCDVKPNHTVLANKGYLPIAMIETTRGCPFACSFCSVTTFFGRNFRHRPPAEVIAEIERQPAHTYFFVDDNVVGNPRAAKELFRALIPLRIRWISQASLTMTRDAELMRLMRESGCAGVLVGVESIQQDNLKQINKSWNTVGIGYDEAFRITRDYGIAIIGSFILGMDGDTPDSLDATLAFAIRHKLFAALFNLLTPYPGTALYDAFVTEGRLRQPRWWLDPSFAYGRMVFEPALMPAAEVETKRMDMYRQFYGARSIAHRLLDSRANARDVWHAFTLLAMNAPAFAQEQRRFGLALGQT